MGFSTEFALRRLDIWYLDKFQKKYTPSLARKIIDDVSNSLLTCECQNREDLEILLTRARNTYCVNRQIVFANNYFSSHYSSMEEMFKLRKSYGLDFNELSNGVYNEYVFPMFETYKPMFEFVNKVREKFARGNNEGISNNEVDSIFLSVFKSHSNLTRMLIDFKHASDVFCDLLVQRGNLSQSIFESQRNFSSASLTVISDLNEVLFSDLERNVV
jgi:hypothetical protein